MSPAKYSADNLNKDGNVKTRRYLVGYFFTYKEAEIALSKFVANPINWVDKPTFRDIRF